MEQKYLSFLCGAGFLTSVVSLTILFYWLNKKGWLTIRLMALLIFLLISSLGVLFWFYVQDKQILFLMLGLGTLAGLSVLSWKVTNPKLVKLLNLKW
jgi:hypothetical protein